MNINNAIKLDFGRLIDELSKPHTQSQMLREGFITRAPREPIARAYVKALKELNYVATLDHGYIRVKYNLVDVVPIFVNGSFVDAVEEDHADVAEADTEEDHADVGVADTEEDLADVDVADTEEDHQHDNCL